MKFTEWSFFLKINSWQLALVFTRKACPASSHCTLWGTQSCSWAGSRSSNSEAGWFYVITGFKGGLFLYREILSPRCWSHSTSAEVGCWGNQQSPSERNQNPHHAGRGTRGPQDPPGSHRHISAVSEWSLWGGEKSCPNRHPRHPVETFLKTGCFVEICCPLLFSACKGCMIIWDFRKQNSLFWLLSISSSWKVICHQFHNYIAGLEQNNGQK